MKPNKVQYITDADIQREVRQLDFEQKCLWRMLVAHLVAAAVLLLGAFAVRADELSDRIAIAIAIETANNPWFPPKPPPPPPPPKQSADERPVVEFLSAEWCGPCKAAKAALTVKVREKLPFRIRDRDVDKEGWQGESGIPVFRWETPNGPMHLQWHSVEWLESEWKRTTKQKTSASTLLTVPQLRAFAKTYSGPLKGIQGKRDDYRSHLLELPNHGFAWWQVKDLSQWECERIHGAQHNGYITPWQILR